MDNPLPHDLEAEAAVLGSCLIDSTVVPYVCSKLCVESFYQRRYQAIFQAIKEAHEKNESIDEITLRDKVEQQYRDSLYDLVGKVPSSAKIHSYVSIVRKHALARRAISTLTDGLHDIEDAGLPDDVVAQVIESLEKAREETQEHESLTIAQVLLAPECTDVAKIHIGAIEDVTGGVEVGDYVLIGGEPGSGKTTLCLQILVEIAKRGEPVYIWSKDQSPKKLAKIAWAGMEGKTIEDVIEDPISFERIAKLPIEFYKGELTVPNIVNSLRIQSARGTKWYLLDYLSLVSAPGHTFKSKWERAGYVSERLKPLLIETESRALIIQRVNKVEAGKPRMQDISGDGSILHDPDMIWFIQHPPERKAGERGEPTKFWVLKNRHGEVPKMAELELKGQYHRFESWRQ